jgi:hypothetical protein
MTKKGIKVLKRLDDCCSGESNPGRLLGRQQASPLAHCSMSLTVPSWEFLSSIFLCLTKRPHQFDTRTVSYPRHLSDVVECSETVSRQQAWCRVCSECEVCRPREQRVWQATEGGGFLCPRRNIAATCSSSSQSIKTWLMERGACRFTGQGPRLPSRSSPWTLVLRTIWQTLLTVSSHPLFLAVLCLRIHDWHNAFS